MAGTGFKYHSKLQRIHEYVTSTFFRACLKIQACTFQDVSNASSHYMIERLAESLLLTLRNKISSHLSSSCNSCVHTTQHNANEVHTLQNIQGRGVPDHQ